MSPSGRQYRPGFRNPDYQEGQISKSRYAWIQTYIGQFVLMRYEEPEDLPEEDAPKGSAEPGPTIRLMLPNRRGKSIYFNLTALTHRELMLLKRLFDMAFEQAEPIVKMRDKAADDAFERGDDSFIRVYRQVPRLVIRKGAVGSDRQGVYDRPEDVPPGSEQGGGDAGRVPGDGDELADGESSGGGPQDDQP